MAAKELLHLINWLLKEGFNDEQIVDCLEYTTGRKEVLSADETAQ